MKKNNYEDKVNELLLKIQQLEERNDFLSKEIERKEDLIEKARKSKPKTEKIENKEKIDVITLADDRKAEKRFEKELNFLNINSLQITDNLVDKEIIFESDKLYGSMYILGDFNGWEPELMQKDEKEFSFRVVLIKGFKFYYSLQTSDDVILDYNSPYEENKRNLQLQNYINLERNEDEETSIFDYKEDLNILKSAQRNYLLLKINDDKENILFLEKFQRHVINEKKKLCNSQKEKKNK